MAVSITNIGTGSVVTASNFSVRAPPGHVPAGAIVFCIILDGSGLPGTLTDSSGNVYTNITSIQSGDLFGWFSGNVVSIRRGDAGITYAQNTINDGAVGSYVYLTGTPPTRFLDNAVSAKASGGFTTQPSLLTSGSPATANQAFLAAAACVRTGSAIANYNQDSGHGWVTPPNTLGINPSGGTETFTLGAGSQINTGTGPVLYQPTFSLIPTTWSTFVVAFTATQVSSAQFNGSGSLSVNAIPAQFGTVRFNGAGSLSVSVNFLVAISAQFNGAGGLSAAGTMPSFNGARFNGTGSFTALTVQATSSNFNGSGGLTASASIAVAGFARFNGAGSLSAQPSGLGGGIQFNGNGNLAVIVGLAQVASARFNGAGSFAPTVSLAQQISATFNGSGSLSANTNQIRQGTIVFGATGGLTVTTISNVAGFARFNGAGSLSATPGTTTTNLVAFSGAGNLSVTTSLAEAAFVQFNGSGSFAANVAFANIGAFATFDGAGSISLLFQGAIFEAATFNGAGSLSASAGKGVAASTALFHGAGSLQVTQIFGAVNISAQFNGAGSLSTLFNLIAFIPPLHGSGSLSANALLANTLNTVHASIGAVGEFPLGQQSAVSPLFAKIAQFNGAGGLVIVGASPQAPVVVELDGQGRMCVLAEVLIGVAGQTDNFILAPGPGPTENVLV